MAREQSSVCSPLPARSVSVSLHLTAAFVTGWGLVCVCVPVLCCACGCRARSEARGRGPPASSLSRGRPGEPEGTRDAGRSAAVWSRLSCRIPRSTPSAREGEHTPRSPGVRHAFGGKTRRERANELADLPCRHGRSRQRGARHGHGGHRRGHRRCIAGRGGYPTLSVERGLTRSARWLGHTTPWWSWTGPTPQQALGIHLDTCTCDRVSPQLLSSGKEEL